MAHASVDIRPANTPAQCADVELRQESGTREEAPGAGLGVDDKREQEQELGQPQGGDDAHHRWRVAQAPDHDDLAEAAYRGGDGEGEGKRHPIRHVPTGDGQAEDGGREGADLAVGEVDDAVRAVDQHEADGEDAVGHTRDGAQQEDRERELQVAQPALPLGRRGPHEGLARRRVGAAGAGRRGGGDGRGRAETERRGHRCAG
jgi:hypothetical protein